MKSILLGVCAAAILLPTAAWAQSVDDDVRCLLLGTGFARAAKDANSRRASALTAAFYLGRLDGRMTGPALVAAVKRLGSGMPTAQATPIMRTCAARAGAAERRLGAIARQGK